MVVCGEQQEQERMRGRVADAMRRIDRKYFVPRKDTKDPRSHLEFMFAVPGQCETAYLVRALLLCARLASRCLPAVPRAVPHMMFGASLVVKCSALASSTLCAVLGQCNTTYSCELVK